MQHLSKAEKYSRCFPGLPLLYWVDINSTCNLRCTMCPQSKGKFDRRPEMSLEMFTALIDSICQNRPLIKLYLSGEPLLHQDLFTMIEYAAIKGCRTMVHTNATLLTQEMSHRLLSSKLNYLTFSFDGCTPEVYERLRYPARYDQVVTNIESYLELRKNYGGRGPLTAIEIIRMIDTEKYISDFAARWEKSGIDAVHVREYLTWLGTVADRRVESLPGTGFKPCASLFTAGCILSDGTVVPCCLDVYGKLALGNIQEESFPAIWVGEKYFQMRRQMVEGNPGRDSICLSCDNIRITQSAINNHLILQRE